MDKVKISIIVPVYNAEEYLDRCLHSVLDQEFPSFEVILVDDGSTDSSPLICDRYSGTDPRFLTIHQKNSGVSAARNAGLNLAQGEYVMFLDSVQSLMDMFGLDMRLVHGIDPEDDGEFFLSDPDWDHVEEVLKTRREECLEFLRRIL